MAHRQPLLDALSAYGQRFPDEADVVARFQEFVTAHDRCFDNDLWVGHVTGSAWLVHPMDEAVLLTHHKKLGRWLQLGGHSDGDADTPAVARREAEEESGLPVELVMPEIFDLDVHAIPARKGDPEHWHFDVRYAFRADHPDFEVTEESHALAWVPIERLNEYTDEWSVLRMAGKWADLLAPI